MKKYIYLLAFASITISCSREIVEPRMTLHERLEQFVIESDKVGFVDADFLVSNQNAKEASNIEMPPDEDLESKILFELYDDSVIPELEQIFKDYGDPSFDFDAFLEARRSVAPDARIAACKEIWSHFVFSNGCETIQICTNCSGDWECGSYSWCLSD